MNKKSLTEADIRTKFITPAIVGTDDEKWNVMTQIREEAYFTKGRVIVRGKTVKRGEAKKADYILFYKPNIPIAFVKKLPEGFQGGVQRHEGGDILSIVIEVH
jgi:type I restriction enzyme R subunit